MVWTDSHCHLAYEGVGEGSEQVAQARAAGVTRMVTVGTDREESLRAIAIAAAHEGVWATVGLHPHDARYGVDTITDLFAADQPGRPKVVAVGECGLDYHYDNSPRADQRTAFAAQIALAHQLGLALVIHTREAWDDTFDILAAEGVPERTIFHCFSGGPAEAARALDLGAHLSFSGIVTFKTAADVRDAAVLCPLDRLLVETDAPFLAPVPHRGKPNVPAFVPLVGAAIAAARSVTSEQVETATTANATAVFGFAKLTEGL